MDNPQDATQEDIHGEWLKTLDGRAARLEDVAKGAAILLAALVLVVAAIIITLARKTGDPQ